MRFSSLRFRHSLVLLLLGAGLAGCSTLAQPTARTYDVRAYGATGDGKALDTEAINQAIDAAAAAGGGMVWFSAGTYASYSIHLKSNVALYLDHGATILAADPPPEGQPGGYDAPEPNAWDKYQDFGHTHWHNSLIWGENLENVSILGPGRIFGKGLTRGYGRKDPLPGEPRLPRPPIPQFPPPDEGTATTPFGYPNPRDTLAAGIGNKAIALKNCRNVILRDFTIYHGGHFGILAIATDNFTIDNLKIDTNRDGMDIDCCRNVRITNCSVNSPWDDGICLKASYGLGALRACENITIANCFLSGNFDEGTLLDATFKRSVPEYKSYRTGRIKLGTESNGDFKNIAIVNCVFDDCRGIAIESVDGAHIEDIAISNITMRHVANSPIFIRLGSRLRGPDNPPVGTIRRISINNVVASDAEWSLGCIISGIPGHPIADIRIGNVRVVQQGGGTKELAERVPPEEEAKYPEPGMFGAMPSYGFFFRHVAGLEMDHVKIDYVQPEARPAFVLDDVQDARFDHLNVRRGTDAAPLFDLRAVADFAVDDSRAIDDTRLPGPIVRQKL